MGAFLISFAMVLMIGLAECCGWEMHEPHDD